MKKGGNGLEVFNLNRIDLRFVIIFQKGDLKGVNYR